VVTPRSSIMPVVSISEVLRNTFGDPRILKAWLLALMYTFGILCVNLPVMTRK